MEMGGQVGGQWTMCGLVGGCASGAVVVVAVGGVGGGCIIADGVAVVGGANGRPVIE